MISFEPTQHCLLGCASVKILSRLLSGC